MNLYNLVIKRVIEEKDISLLLKIPIININRPIQKTIIKALVSYYKRYNTIPSYIILKNSIYQQISNDKISIYISMLENIEEMPTDKNISEKEIIDSINNSALLHNIDNNIEKLINSAKDKDIATVKKILKTLEESVNTHDKQPVDIKQINYAPEQIQIVESFLESHRDNNFKLGGLTIIGGSSGGGKSIYTLQQLMYSYKVEKKNVCLLNLEIAESDIIARMYSLSNDVDYNSIYGKEDIDTINKIEKWKNEYFTENNVFLIKSINYNSDEIEQTVRDMASKGIEVFAIDYLQIVEFNTSSEEWKQLSFLVKLLHRLTLEFKIAILSPVQVNFSDTQIKNNELTITVRGSKELHNSATVFLFIYQNAEQYKEKVAVIYTLKARNAQKLNHIVQTDFTHMKFISTGIVL